MRVGREKKCPAMRNLYALAWRKLETTGYRKRRYRGRGKYGEKKKKDVSVYVRKKRSGLNADKVTMRGRGDLGGRKFNYLTHP